MVTKTRASTVVILSLLFVIRAGAASIRVREVTTPFPAVARVAAGPAGSLLCLDWKTRTLKVLSARGGDARIDLALPAAAQVTNLGGGDGQTVVTTSQHGTFVLQKDGSVRARFEAREFAPYVAAAVDRSSAYGMGTAGDENGRIRADWLVTRVDLEHPKAPRDLVTDATFADPFARAIYPLGYLLLSSDRSTLYASWEGSPRLYVIPMAGGAAQAITLTAGEKAPPRATPELRAAAIADRDSFYKLRSRYRWPQGLLRGPGDTVGILFREPASGGNAFTLDLYSREGKKLGASLALDVHPRSATAHARVVTATDGAQYVIINELEPGNSGVKNQRLYSVDLRP
jgi:hypothetical protein